MQSTLSQVIAGVAGEGVRKPLQDILTAIVDRLNSVATASAGLVIKAATSALAKTGATAFHGTAGGVPVTIAASTDMPALVGSITAAYFNVFCFFVDSTSVVTVAMGTEGLTLARVKFPQIPTGKALVGYLVVTHASTFVGGTTALDTATTNYVSPVGAFDPTFLI